MFLHRVQSQSPIKVQHAIKILSSRYDCFNHSQMSLNEVSYEKIAFYARYMRIRINKLICEKSRCNF